MIKTTSLGKIFFTKKEVEAIRKLILQKVTSSPEKQKAIRAKIRKIGFYFSDFEFDKPGYTIADFEKIIKSGRIKILSNSQTKASIVNPLKTLLPVKENWNKADKSLDSKEILIEAFKINRFHPNEHDEMTINDAPGNYVICLRKKAILPAIMKEIKFTNFHGLRAIYTGLASISLRTRDFKQHFTGNNAGGSTLRKSLGVLFAYALIPRDKSPNSTKTKFKMEDEIRLSSWMTENLVMFFLPSGDFKNNEERLIKFLNPPLNLKGNKNIVNREFRRILTNLRNKKG